MMRTVLALAGAALLGACGEPDQLSVDGVWVRLAAVPGRPAAAYFTVHGGPAPATLINVSSNLAVRSEMHESMAGGMRPLPSVPVPAEGVAAFRPGGRHVMLFDVNPEIKPGRTMVFTFTFRDGTRIRHTATAIGAADPAPE